MKRTYTRCARTVSCKIWRPFSAGYKLKRRSETVRTRNMANDSRERRLTVNLCPPPIPRLVSLRQVATRFSCKCNGHDWCSPKYLLYALPCWTSDIVEAAKSTAHYFHTHFLSDYFLLNTYFLAISCYKHMHLTTSAYGMPKPPIYRHFSVLLCTWAWWCLH